MNTLTPEVIWAQRSSATDPAKNIIFLTINCADITPESLKIEITPTLVSFAGTTVKGVDFAVNLELYAEIVPEESKKHYSTRGVDFVLRKKEAKAEYWSRLLKESKRMHWLKTDFDKWVDEDEQEDGPDGFDEMDFGDGGMGGLDFSKLAASQGLSGIPDNIPRTSGDDSDDEDLPELEDTNPNLDSDKKAEESAGKKEEADKPADA